MQIAREKNYREKWIERERKESERKLEGRLNGESKRKRKIGEEDEGGG